MNAAINVADAACVHFAGRRHAGASHKDALDVVKELVPAHEPLAGALGRHLRPLLGLKNAAQYDGSLLGEGDARVALRHLDRILIPARALAARAGWPPE